MPTCTQQCLPCMFSHAAKVCITVGLCSTAFGGFLCLPLSGLSFELPVHGERYIWASFLLGLVVTT